MGFPEILDGRRRVRQRVRRPEHQVLLGVCTRQQAGRGVHDRLRALPLLELTEQLSLKLTSKTTLYTSEYAKYISGGALTDTGFGGGDNGVALSYALTDNISLGANLNYLYKIDHRVRHAEGWDSYSAGGSHGAHNGILYGGVSVSLAF